MTAKDNFCMSMSTVMAKMHIEGFILDDTKSIMYALGSPSSENRNIVFFFDVERRGRTDEEIGVFIRTYLVCAKMMSGYYDLDFQYTIKEG